MTPSYNYWVVALSFLVALLAAYRAIHIANEPSRQDAAEIRIRILIGGITLGTGIWGMHFIGMLALHIPIPLYYDTPITLVSGLFAILAMIFGLWQIHCSAPYRLPLPGTAIAMGAGISIMHYTGMAAIRMQPTIHYDPGLFALSILIAIAAAYAAIKVMLLLPDYRDHPKAPWLRLGSALFLATGISGMHYTGMAAAGFRPDSLCLADPGSLTPTLLLAFVALMLVLVIVLGHFATAKFNAFKDSQIKIHSEKTLPLFLFLLLTSLTFLAWKGQQEATQQQARFEFDHLAQDYVQDIAQEMDTRSELLLGLAAFYASSKEVDSDEFRTYTTRTFYPKRHFGVQALGILHPQDLGQPNSLHRNCYGPALKVRTEDLAPRIHTTPAEPLQRLVWSPALQRGLSRSLISERPTLLPIQASLAGAQKNAFNAVMVYPIFHNGSPHDTPALRCANLLGWAYAGIDLQRLLRPLQRPGISAALYEGNATTESAIAWRHGDPSQAQTPQTPYSSTQTLQAGNNLWTLTIQELQDQNDPRYDKSTFIAMLGVASALFVATLVLLLNQARIRTLNLANSLTEEIAKKENLLHYISGQNQLLENALQTKSRFLSTMSHELRTPLNSILGFSEILADAHSDPAQKEILNHIQGSGKHLLSLINDALDLAKIEAGRMFLQKDHEDVYLLLSACLTSLQTQAQKKGITLILDAAQNLGPIWTDVRKVRQITLNLLSNAVKFSPAGSHVTLHAQRVSRAQIGLPSAARPAIHFNFERSHSTDFLEISVEDPGIGIAESDFAKLFQPFSQIDSTLSRAFEGTGLGLALTKGFVEQLGGALALQSRPHQGSRFTVWVPWEMAP